MPMQRWRYAENFEQRARLVKEAAGWRCQACGKRCRRPGEPFDTQRRTLTAAHLDHDPENEHARLAALCVPCHRLDIYADYVSGKLDHELIPPATDEDVRLSFERQVEQLRSAGITTSRDILLTAGVQASL